MKGGENMGRISVIKESDTGTLAKKYKREQMHPDIPLHGLRHTSATLLISQNVDVKTVSNRLGHAQTSTTMDIYSHALKKMDEQAAAVLDDLLIKKA